MDQSDRSRMRQRNKNIVNIEVAKDQVKEDDEKLEIKLHQKLTGKIPKFEQNSQPKNIRLHLSRYFDEQKQHPLILQYLISFLGKVSPQQQIRKKCKRYLQLKLQNGRSVEEGFSLHELSHEKKKSISDYAQQIQKLDKDMEKEMHEKEKYMLQSQKLKTENSALEHELKKQKEFEENLQKNKKELERAQLQGRKKRGKGTTEYQIKEKIKKQQKQISLRYKELTDSIAAYNKQKKQGRKQQTDERQLRRKYNSLCCSKADIQAQTERLQQKIQRQNNLLNINLSSIPDRSSIIHSSQRVSNGPSFINQLREKSQIHYRSQIYNFEQVPQNRFIKIILVVIAVILGVGLVYGLMNRAISQSL